MGDCKVCHGVGHVEALQDEVVEQHMTDIEPNDRLRKRAKKLLRERFNAKESHESKESCEGSKAKEAQENSEGNE